MAIDFNGTTSMLLNSSANMAITTTFSCCAWVFAEGNFATFNRRIMVANEDNNSYLLYHTATANQIGFAITFSSIQGLWTVPATDGQWNALSFSYDGTSVSNDPIARVNFQPVTATRATAPVGTMSAPLGGYCIGNVSNQSRTWDGMIQHVQWWNVVVSAADLDLSGKMPGSVTTGLKLWLPMRVATEINDESGNGLHGTATALTDRDPNPPVGVIKKMIHYHA